MQQLELPGNIDATGNMTVSNRDMLLAWVKSHKDKAITLTVKVKKKKRSNNQNAYYWYIVVPLITRALNDLGNEFDNTDTHEFLKARFNAKQVEVNDGHYIDVPQSTTGLSTIEFNEYKEKIQRFASEMLGLYIPDPNEQLELDSNF
jgi:hypothetical protein